MIEQFPHATKARSNLKVRQFRKPRKARSRAGIFAFSLVEVTLAIGVIAFCLIALVGMVPVGLKAEQGSYDQTQGMRLLNEIQKDFSSIAKPYSDPNNPANSEQGQIFLTTNRFQIPMSSPNIPVTDPNGVSPKTTGNFTVDDSFYLSSGTTNTNVPPRYAVHYDYTHYNASSPGSPPTYLPYQIRVTVAWPATTQFQGSGTSLVVTGARGYLETIMTINRL